MQADAIDNAGHLEASATVQFYDVDDRDQDIAAATDQALRYVDDLLDHGFPGAPVPLRCTTTDALTCDDA